MPLSDEALMELVCQGQADLPAEASAQAGAFEELVRRYQNKLLAVAYRSLKEHATAEDLVGETFTAVWEERHSFDKNIANFSTWIYTILRNQIDKFLRDSRKAREMISLASVEEDKDDYLVERDWSEDLPDIRLEILNDAVMRYLSDGERQLYHLKDELGLSYEQISQQEPFKGVRIDTLKKRRQYYKDKLIKALNPPKAGLTDCP